MSPDFSPFSPLLHTVIVVRDNQDGFHHGNIDTAESTTQVHMNCNEQYEQEGCDALKWVVLLLGESLETCILFFPAEQWKEYTYIATPLQQQILCIPLNILYYSMLLLQSILLLLTLIIFFLKAYLFF